MPMKESKFVTKDPVCGMTVDEATALQTERDGETVYFCSDKCREVFIALPESVKEPESRD
nr:YHS domain-containing protein [Desulfobulbaceae bacterium]